MIELLRYHRLKPRGLASARAVDPLIGTPGVLVEFKRFSPEDAGEIEPEQSVVTVASLQERLAEIVKEREVILEFLSIKQG